MKVCISLPQSNYTELMEEHRWFPEDLMMCCVISLDCNFHPSCSPIPILSAFLGYVLFKCIYCTLVYLLVRQFVPLCSA